MTGHHHTNKQNCRMCNRHKSASKMLPATLVRAQFVPIIRSYVPDWSTEGYLCFVCLDKVRNEYVADLLKKDLGELDSLEQEVVKSLQDNQLLTENINESYQQQLSFGERLADRVAEFGGSWLFIVAFSAVLVLWIIVNSFLLIMRPFDPYPYILLNLFLSMLAAMQAPIIMMSQKRQEQRDRLRAENDYQVNLKAEVEIRMLNEKMDQLIHHHWHRMQEIQQIQMEMIEDIHRKLFH